MAVNRGNVKYVKPGFRRRVKGKIQFTKEFILAPAYAAGRIFVSNILISLLFQVNHEVNERISTILI